MSKETTEKKETEIKPSGINATTLDYANRIAANAMFYPENSTVGDIKGQPTAYLATLPDTLTPDQVRNVREHDKFFAQGAAVATHRMAIEAMVADDTVHKVKGHFNMEGNSTSATVQRSVSFTPPNNANGEKKPIVKVGYLTAEITQRIAGSSEWHNMQAELGRNAEEAFKKM